MSRGDSGSSPQVSTENTAPLCEDQIFHPICIRDLDEAFQCQINRETQERLTSPRWTGEENSFVKGKLDPVRIKNLKTITVHPGDLVGDSVDLCVVHPTRTYRRVFLNSIDLRPPPGSSKRDHIAPHSCKTVD